MTTFFRPYGQVRIRNSAGDKWFFSSKETPFLMGINLIIKMGMVATFSFSLEAPFMEGIAMLDGGAFAQGNQIGVRIGYADGGATPWFFGKFTSGGDGLVLNSDGLSGQVSCQTLADSVWYEVPASQLKNVGSSDALKIIAEYMGAELVVSQNLNGRFLEADAIYFLGKGAPSSRSAWDWITYLCSEAILNAAYTVVFNYAGQRVLYVGTKEDVSNGTYADQIGGVVGDESSVGQVRRITYQMRGPLDPKNGIYPIMTWGPDAGLAQWDMIPDAASGGVKADYIDESTGETIKIDANPYGQEEAVSGSLENPGPTDEENDGVVMDKSTVDGRPPTRVSVPGGEGVNGEKAVQRAAQSRQGEGNAAQKATISTLGVPNEFPGNLCNVLGCSRRYDDVYEVREVSHQWAGSDWNMSLTVLRQGRGGIPGDKPDEIPAAGTMPEAS